MRTFLRESFLPVLLLLCLISAALVVLKDAAEKSSRAPRQVHISMRDVAGTTAPSPGPGFPGVGEARADTLDGGDLADLLEGQESSGRGLAGRAMRMAAHDSLPGALALTAAAIARNPKDSRAWFARGFAYSKRGERSKAIEAYEKSVAMSGGSGKAPALYNLACLYKDAGRVQDAIATFEKAIDERPNYVEARLNLASAMADRPADREEAYRQYEQLLRLAPTYPQAWFNRGIMRMRDGATAAAIDDFRHAVEIDQKFSKAWYNIGVLSSRQGNDAEAVEAYRRAVAADPENAKAWLNLAESLADADRYAEAIQVGRETVARSPTYASAWYNLALSLSHSGQAEEARKAYEKVLKLDESNARAWQNLGVIYARQRKSRKAMECYREALALDPANIGARYNLALEYRRAGDLDGAITEAIRLYRLDPDHSKARQFLRSTAKRILENDPGNAEAKRVLEEVGSDE